MVKNKYNKMIEFNKKIEEIIEILNDYKFNMRFRMGSDELYYYNDDYNNHYMILNTLNNTISFITVENNISTVDSIINNISDNKEALVEKLNDL